MYQGEKVIYQPKILIPLGNQALKKRLAIGEKKKKKKKTSSENEGCFQFI